MAWDRFMVSQGIGTNRKVRRLTPAERWTWVAGVLALAAESPRRGVLLIAKDLPVEARDVADHATVSVKTATKTLLKAEQIGLLERADGVLHIHDWGEFNPDPKPSDSRQAWAERKRRQREQHGATPQNVPRDIGGTSRESHAPEVEVEVEVEVDPPIVPPEIGGEQATWHSVLDELANHGVAESTRANVLGPLTARRDGTALVLSGGSASTAARYRDVVLSAAQAVDGSLSSVRFELAQAQVRASGRRRRRFA